MVMKKAPLLLRTVAYTIQSRVNTRDQWPYERRIIAEGAVKTPDFVLIAHYGESWSC